MHRAGGRLQGVLDRVCIGVGALVKQRAATGFRQRHAQSRTASTKMTVR